MRLYYIKRGTKIVFLVEAQKALLDNVYDVKQLYRMTDVLNLANLISKLAQKKKNDDRTKANNNN